MKTRRIAAVFVCFILLLALPCGIAGAAGPTLSTTLKDGAVVRNSRLTFEVYARDESGGKADSAVTLNGDSVSPAWDDSDKTSYTLSFDAEGEYTVAVEAVTNGGSRKSITYSITYVPAADGEVIGSAVWSVEAFTLGCGYIVEPMRVPIRAGETAADAFLRLLKDSGLACFYSGDTKEGFYLAYIADGDCTLDRYNGYGGSGRAPEPRKLNLSPSIPGYLARCLEDGMDFFDPDEYTEMYEGFLGEFVCTNGSGWMYSVGGSFPNVGFSDCYLSDGDVVRVQFTLGYGADIGGTGALGGQIPGAGDVPQAGYYPVADKDALTSLLADAAEAGLAEGEAYKSALSAACEPNASQSAVDAAAEALREALAAPEEPSSEEPEMSEGTEEPITSEEPAAPETSEEPKAPEASEESAVPETSEVPAVPEASEVPAAPEISEEPAAPEISEEPAAPETSEVPKAPEASEEPAAPETSEEPAAPETSEEPAAPETPEEPAAPEASEEPAAPETSEVTEEPSHADPMETARGIIEWKKADLGCSADEPLLCDGFISLAGTTAGDWYPIGLSRLGADDSFDKYLSVLREHVEERYRTPEKLHSAKATEWHRIALAVLAAGGDPTAFGVDENGKAINLIADGTYDRGKTAPLGKQGINGLIWGLIALDSRRYEVPEGAADTREDIIRGILSRQLADGGWALTGSVPDPDLTAMAVQALSPYCVGDAPDVEEETLKAAAEAVERALACLSEMQLPTGDFKSWGTQNAESTAQVIIALCCLGIDPLADARFIKEGNTLLDGLMRYRQEDGGFAHSFDYDSENPSAVPGESNSMAGEQVLLAMAAMCRLKNGESALYDFRIEGGQEPDTAKEFTAEDRRETDALPEKLTTEYYVTVTALLDKLLSSPDFEGRDGYLQKLTTAKEQIAQIQAEIDGINAEIREKLYPFEDISLGDRKTVQSIAERCMALSEYDRARIEHFDDVVRAKAKVEGALRAAVIGAALALAAVLLAVLLSVRIVKKKRRKAKEMELLASEYEDA